METSFGYHIVKVTAPKTSQTYQLAAIVKNVQPSDATREAAYSKAERLAADGNSLDAFRALPTKDKTLQKQEAKFLDPRCAGREQPARLARNRALGLRLQPRWRC
ncbi:MAG: hypothetical protein WKG07_12405 [Hymenobacter sp.]